MKNQDNIALIVLITVGTRSGAVLCNSFTSIPLCYLACLVGQAGVRLLAVVDRMHKVGVIGSIPLVGQLGLDAGAVLLVRALLLALPPAVCRYNLARRFFLHWEKKHSEKHLLNKPGETSVP